MRFSLAATILAQSLVRSDSGGEVGVFRVSGSIL